MTQNQQNQVYLAQAQIDVGMLFASLNEADAYLQNALRMPWWSERFPRVKDVELHSHRGKKCNGVGEWYDDTWTGHIELAPTSRNERTLIHELAHVCAIAEHGHRAHGPAFVGIYLELVFRLMGNEAWVTLREAMKAEDVTW